MSRMDDEFKNLIGSRRSVRAIAANPLLVAAPVGAPKPRLYAISNKEARVYGKPNLPDKFHAADCVNSWDFGQEVDAKTQREAAKLKAKQPTVAPDTIFGKPNRPPTPIKDVIENGYQLDWVQSQIKQQQAEQQAHAQFHTAPHPGPAMTKAAALRSQHTLKHAAEMAKLEAEAHSPAPQNPGFKMKRFQNVKSKLQTS